MIVIQRRFSDVRIRETETAPTIEAGVGGGGGNIPMILEERNKLIVDVIAVDQYNQCTTGGVTRTLSARDYKGVGTQYVEEGKLIIEIRDGD
ncbi:MAG: hypothetical protein IKF90_10050 [Parasporobacterium sp.]|nr:hypothetical protein [Parasporobacterium sp.]